MKEGCYLWIRLIGFFMVSCAVSGCFGSHQRDHDRCRSTNKGIQTLVTMFASLLICNFVLCMLGVIRWGFSWVAWRLFIVWRVSEMMCYNAIAFIDIFLGENVLYSHFPRKSWNTLPWVQFRHFPRKILSISLKSSFRDRKLNNEASCCCGCYALLLYIFSNNFQEKKLLPK